MASPQKIDIKKAIKQRLQGRSYKEIADAQGVKPQSVHTAIAPLLEKLADPAAVEVYRNKQAEILDGMAARTLASITDGDLEKAGLRDKVVATGILIDKSRLISGASTQNHLVIHANAGNLAATGWGDGFGVTATLEATPDDDELDSDSDNS